MKATITGLSVALACLALAGQQPPRRAAGSGLAERFKQLDRNGDGKLTPPELANPERFRQMDADGDGAVTLDEAARFFAADTGPATDPASPSGADPAGWFMQLDRDGDGRLSRAEVNARPGLRAAFDYIDANRDGTISPDELTAAMARWRQGATDPRQPTTTRPPSKQATTSVARSSASTRPASPDVNWPQFRGSRGDGVAYGANLPVTWSNTNNVVWSCPIPGKGWSSPIVWGERVFVTSAVCPGAVVAMTEARGFSEHVQGVTSAAEHQYMLYCVDWRTGKPLWSRCAHEGVPPRPIHPKNSYATETPTTDGERVYACFGDIGVFCYDMDGRELWSRKWGSFRLDWSWGPAASPVLHGDLLFVLNDNREKSFLVALDKRTGRDVWRVDRDERSNWCNPFVWQHPLRTEIVTSGSGRVRSYDLKGTLLWELRGMSGVTVPTPFAADGLLYTASGCSHSARRPVYAIRPGASGDISLGEDATSNAHVAWCQRRAAAYVTSPLVYDGLLYVLLDRGQLSAYDAASGQPVYGNQRLAAGRVPFSASPWAYDGKVFCLSEAGDTYVVQAGPDFRVLHVNRLGEPAMATPAVARDSVVLRALTRLYRIAKTADGKKP
jgi:outer membrane protein assembly factor BamB